MNNVTRILSVATLALALASGAAYADPDKTREQGQGKLASAQQDCDTIMALGHTRAQLFPGTCEQATVANQVRGKTREQVQTELAAAQQSGDIGSIFAGVTERELFPGDYPAVATAPGKTREQVQAELAAAQQSGDIGSIIAGVTERELFPGKFEKTTTTTSEPYSATQTSGKTRAQVYAELVAAEKAGDIPVGEDGLTPRERFPQLYQTTEAPQDVANAGAVSAN